MKLFKNTVFCFISVNLLVVGFIILAVHKPLIAFGLFLLVVLNSAVYRIVKASSKDVISENLMDNAQLGSSQKILRYAASGLAFLSWMTTAGGLTGFAFDHSWQAFLASFAIQAILLIFSFMLCQFYVSIIMITALTERFKRLITYAMVFLFIIALLFSSSFSYVFISNNVYKDVKAVDSNIVIEEFLINKTYLLKGENDRVGLQLKNLLDGNLEHIANVVTQQTGQSLSDQRDIVNNYPKNNPVSAYTGNIAIVFDDMALNDVYNLPANRSAGTPIEPLEQFRSLIQSYYDSYKDSKDDYTEYLERYENYSADSPIDLNAQIQGLDHQINTLDNMDIQSVIVNSYPTTLDQYKNALDNEITALKNAYATLSTHFQGLQAAVDLMNQAQTASDSSIIDLNKIVVMIYSSSVDLEAIDEIMDNLQQNLDLMLSQAAADDTGSTDDNEVLNSLNQLLNYLRQYHTYAVLSGLLDTMIDDELSKTYLLVNEEEAVYGELVDAGSMQLLARSDGQASESEVYQVTEEKWREERKQQFYRLINCAKLLSSLNEANLSAAGVDGLADNSAGNGVVEIDVEAVESIISDAYVMNRDLLENITNFEQAVNFFKYKFRAMAYVSLCIALFLDLGSFLVGCFMFISRYAVKKEDRSTVPEADGDKPDSSKDKTDGPDADAPVVDREEEGVPV